LTSAFHGALIIRFISPNAFGMRMRIVVSGVSAFLAKEDGADRVQYTNILAWAACDPWPPNE
jgi:hypothetical protein